MANKASSTLEVALRDGRYTDVLASDEARVLIRQLGAETASSHAVQGDEENKDGESGRISTIPSRDEITIGMAALNAFLQSNVTGPVLEADGQVEAAFIGAFQDSLLLQGAVPSKRQTWTKMRRHLLRSLDVDGVSIYPHIPHIQLFCLARYVFLTRQCTIPGDNRDPNERHACLEFLEGGSDDDGSDEDAASRQQYSLGWMRLRVLAWHYKLITQPSLGPGSAFNKSMQWSDVPSLQEEILSTLADVESAVLGSGPASGAWTRESKVQFLLEKANICITLGRDKEAKESLDAAAGLSGFVYALSGAMGKRTRFQEKSTSQLVVLAKSAAPADGKSDLQEARALPEALPLNDDTVLENIDFTRQDGEKAAEASTTLPAALSCLAPDEQPQLSPLDQIILLAEATLKDAFSPVDSLTSEEILPFAVRVISDKSTNWQIYTHALLVRSRIEVHRSRTVERGVLQMQAVADQVIVDTTASAPKAGARVVGQDEAVVVGLPAVEVTPPEEGNTTTLSAPKDKPTSFFPAPKPQESTPAQVRLRYIHALSSPPRWHLESELAYSWAGVGSMVSALEIFKRLRLWAEVALCLASSAAAEDEDGRGSGGEDKARAILRWRLFHRTTAAAPEAGTGSTTAAEPAPEDETDEDAEEGVDTSELKASDYMGPERSPPPPNAPRLFCILGDMDDEPRYYERAWELSKRRFGRAQKSLGEHYLQKRDWERARDAYRKAVAANRLSPDMWSRLGDISLRLGAFADAAEAYGRAIGAANDVVGGEDARTWSNLGSSLYSLYCERMDEVAKGKNRDEAGGEPEEDEEEAPRPLPTEEDEEASPESSTTRPDPATGKRDPATLLSQSLAAYKRGASIAHDNWRIWDNVITLASRIRPLPVSDMVIALRNVISIRKTEDALDDDVLRLLLNNVVLSSSSQGQGQPQTTGNAAREPGRGTPERAVCDLLEQHVVPLITKRSELWELIARERIWRREYAGAIDAAEKAWRAATSSGSIAGLGGGSLVAPAAAETNGSSESGGNWLVDLAAWQMVVRRTDELVSLLENWGSDVPEIGEKKWRIKARSAIRSVMGKAREPWEGTEEWNTLEGLMEGLKS